MSEDNVVTMPPERIKGPNGGARPGAGRKKGYRKLRNVELSVEATGATPRDVMIDIMRFHFAQAIGAQRRGEEWKDVKVYLDAAMHAAEKVAKFVHPMMQSVVASVSHGDLKNVNVKDARAKLEQLIAKRPDLISESGPTH